MYVCIHVISEEVLRRARWHLVNALCHSIHTTTSTYTRAYNPSVLQIEADVYISAMPVDVMKRMEPKTWQNMPYFRQMDELEVCNSSVLLFCDAVEQILVITCFPHIADVDHDMSIMTCFSYLADVDDDI